MLEEIYYNPESGFLDAGKLKQKLKEKGIEIKTKEIQKFINEQKINQLTKKNKSRNSFIPRYPLQQLQIDLIFFDDLSKSFKLNAGNKLALTVIDIFSKLANAYPLKNKNANSVLEAMKMALKDLGIPDSIYSDLGSEFINNKFQNLLKSKNILFIPAKNHAPFVEVFNRTLKTRISKYLQATGSKTIINVLPKFVKNYNNSYHSSIGMKPVEVNKNNMHIVQMNLINNARNKKIQQLKVGDQVRILKKLKSTDKGFKPKYSKSIYPIEEIKTQKNFKFYLVNEKLRLRSELLKIDHVNDPNLDEIMKPLLEDTLEGRLKEQAKLPKLPADVIQKEESISKRKGKRKIKKPKKLDL